MPKTMDSLIQKAFQCDCYLFDSTDTGAHEVIEFVLGETTDSMEALERFDDFLKRDRVVFLISEKEDLVVWASRGATEAYQQRRREK